MFLILTSCNANDNYIENLVKASDEEITKAFILEDPVKDSSHFSLIPFWSTRLGKNKLNAVQLSDRIGKLYCQDNKDRVFIGGKAVTYSKGSLWLR